MSELNLSIETTQAMLNADSQVLSMKEVEEGVQQAKMFHPLVKTQGALEYIRQKYREDMTNGNVIFYCPDGLNVSNLVVAGSVSTNNEIPVITCNTSDKKEFLATTGLVFFFMLIVGLYAFFKYKNQLDN